MLPIGVLASSGGSLKYYITKVTQSTGYSRGVTMDGAGEVSFGYTEGSSPYYAQYSTVTASATYGTSARWTNSTGSPKLWSMRKAGTSLYLTSFPDNQSASSEIVKVNNSGSKLWSRSFNVTGTQGSEIDLDSSENVYLVTKGIGTGNQKWQVAKYNSSGTIQWQKMLQGDTNCLGYNIAVSPTGTVYTAGSCSSNSTPQPFIFKLDSSGTKQLVIWINNGGYALKAIRADSSGNIYVMWTDGGYTYLSKGNSSGANQWTRRISVNNSYDFVIDPSDNIYVIAGGYTTALYVFKYNSSGTIQWQRSIASSSGYLYADAETSKIYVNGDAIAFTAQETGNADALLFKLPSNGTLTGTYAMGGYNYTWAASSITETSATYAWSDNTLYYSVNPGNGTDAAGNISPSTFTPTTTTKELP